MRGDKGGENNDIRKHLEDYGGIYIAGRSVHNQRIERLWVDVGQKITHFYKPIFYALENYGLLDLESIVDMAALHVVYEPVLQNAADNFVGAWNNHSVRTMRNKTPAEIFDAPSRNGRPFHDVTQELRQKYYGIEEDGAEEGNLNSNACVPDCPVCSADRVHYDDENEQDNSGDRYNVQAFRTLPEVQQALLQEEGDDGVGVQQYIRVRDLLRQHL